MKDHVTLLKSEVEEYQELLRAKHEEIAMVEGRIQYLRSVNTRKNQRKVYKRCSVEGCNKFAQKGGVCNVHGAGKMARICVFEGCKNHAKLRGGVCRRHGERKICTIPGCKSLVTKGTYCNEHRTDGYKKKPQGLCNFEGCTNHRKKGGFCRRHYNESVEKTDGSNKKDTEVTEIDEEQLDAHLADAAVLNEEEVVNTTIDAVTDMGAAQAGEETTPV